MKKEELSEALKKGSEIAEILAYLKSQGFAFEGEKKGFMECLLIMNRIPNNKQT